MNDFKNKRVLILGDVMIDEYIYGTVNRISPEAPVQIVDYDSKDFRLGGAGNVAMNIKSLGGKPVICSVVGTKRKKLDGILSREKIENHLISSQTRHTTYKTRIVSNQTQLLRIDYETKHDLNQEDNRNFLTIVDSILKSNVDVVIFSDYDKGVLNKNNIQHIIKICKELNIPTIVDPKKNNFYEYSGATVFKPNLKELKQGIKDFKSIDHSEEYRNELVVEKLMVTLSENGIHYNDGVHKHNINGYDIKIADVSGAGDTVTAVLALLYCNNYDSEYIIKACNLAGSIVCSRFGVSTITAEELFRKLEK
jgi:rfaE bifunctional protein kinase chain/domain